MHVNAFVGLIISSILNKNQLTKTCVKLFFKINQKNKTNETVNSRSNYR